MQEVSFYIIWGGYFISLYFVIFWILVLLEKGYQDPILKPLKKFHKVSVIIPAYNEEKAIAETIESVLALDYPKDKLEIIAANHSSQDDTLKIMNNYKDKIKIITVPRKGNERKGAAINAALKIASGEFVACLDADSSIEPRALHKMLPYFKDKDIGAVLPRIITRKPISFIQRIQYCEYIIVFFYKKMMGGIDCLYTTPGPFSLYRKNVIKKLGGFDPENLTEDMEFALKLQKNNYKIIQTTYVEAQTYTPKTFKTYFSQRNRWYKGALFNVLKHKDLILNKKYHDFGILQMPFIPGAALLSLLVFTIIAIDKIFIPLFDKIQIYSHSGFNLNAFLAALKNFTLLDLNFDVMFWFWLLILTQLVLIITAYKVTKRKLFANGIHTPIAFLLVYSFTIFIVWWFVIIDLIKKRKQAW